MRVGAPEAYLADAEYATRVVLLSFSRTEFLSEPVLVPGFNVTTVYFIGPENVLIQLTQKNET